MATWNPIHESHDNTHRQAHSCATHLLCMQSPEWPLTGPSVPSLGCQHSLGRPAQCWPYVSHSLGGRTASGPSSASEVVECCPSLVNTSTCTYIHTSSVLVTLINYGNQVPAVTFHLVCLPECPPGPACLTNTVTSIHNHMHNSYSIYIYTITTALNVVLAYRMV